MDNGNMKILIVEDDQFLREFYQELLMGEGYNIDVSGDGQEALGKIQNGGYNLILLDIMLPKLDGLEILRQIKLSPAKQQNGPIVILSNLGQDSVIKQAFDLGAGGYLIKSAMNPDQVLEEIKNFLNKTPNG